MQISKRDLLKMGFFGAGLILAVPKFSLGWGKPLARLNPAPAPIGVAERKARVAKAQRLMQQAGIGALIIEPGSSMVYFSGIKWWRSERLTALVVPAEGDIAVVTPYFEEPSIRESLAFGEDVRTWHENENPFVRVVEILKDRKVWDKPIGMEETVRFFVTSSLREVDPHLTFVSGAGIVRGCRMYKSKTEIDLMQHASDITIDAYRQTYRKISSGMQPEDIASIMAAEMAKKGGQPIFQLVLIGQASAYPHGSDKPAVVKEGEVILMDCGCAFEDYHSDISRTFVYGEPTPRQREVWKTVQAGQQLAFETAQIGTPAGVVDETVRAFYESMGFGPGYQTPGMPHRLGHGIGMDGHEPINLVQGETHPLTPGMCFSNEPGLYIYGEFGVRLEDCFHMTNEGPKWFSTPPVSIDKPI